MIIISAILRRIGSTFLEIGNFFRILKLRLLYPGLSIDFSTRIEACCNIRCIKGGSLIIRNSHISFGTQLIADSSGKLLIDGSFVGRNCVITSKESVRIATGTKIAEMVVIRDQDHLIELDPIQKSRKGFVTSPVLIGENVWIAAKATILKGVTIGSGSVVAASAVVNKSVPAGELWGGVPAKFLKTL